MMITDTIAEPFCIEIGEFYGHWVAISEGEVLAHDMDLNRLMGRTENAPRFVEYQYLAEAPAGKTE
jgi:hypothetical protein